MVEKANEISQVIDKLAEKLGVPAELVFDSLVKRAKLLWIEGLSAILSSLIVIFFTFLLAKKFKDEDARFFICVIGFAVGGALLFLGLALFPGNIVDYLAPESYAIREILKAFK